MRRLLICLGLTIAVIGSATAAAVDGTYQVNLPGSGGRCVAGPIVRLTIARGQLSGVLVGGAGGTQTIGNLVLKPDGSFTASTSGDTGGSQPEVPWTLSGQFSGNTVTISGTGGTCGTLTGQGTRAGG
jgi:hypothetical protein